MTFLSSLAPKLKSRVRKSAPEVGWLLQTNHAAFVWDAPRPYQRKEKRPDAVKSLAYCPAIIDLEAKLVEVPCPFDLHLGISVTEDSLNIVNRKGDRSGITDQTLSRLVIVAPQSHWRDPKRPIFQIRTPYTFLSDDAVYMSQLPPFLDYAASSWPGIMVGGRIPIHVWPRALNWAFEWHDTQKDLVLERGQPWFYCRFETGVLQQNVRLVEAAMTPALKEYLAGIEGVAGYTAKTFSLFSVAQKRRPQQLLFKVERKQATAVNGYSFR
jgi:hypothetical protein